MRSKVYKKVIAIVLLTVIMVSVPYERGYAAYSYTGKSFTKKEGGILGIGATKYTYKIYGDSTISWYIMFNSLDVCPPIYHSRNKGETFLSYTQSQSYTSQTAYNFSVSAGCKVGISSLVDSTATATGGLTRTKSYTATASGNVGRTIPSSANTGYYKMTICYNFDKYRLDKYKSGSSTKIKSYYVAVPTGGAYVAVLYGKTTSDSAYSKY